MARLAAGKTQSSLATEIDVSQAFLSKLEDGLKPDVPRKVVESLADSTGYPVDFFFREGARRSMSEELFRKTKSVGAKVLSRADALVNIKRLEIEILLPKVELETRDRPEWEPEDFSGGPREIARRLRHLWRLSQGPIENVIELLEDCGCVVIYFDFGTPKIDGLTMFAADGTPLVFLNPQFPVARLRATAAHELGHVIMHRVPSAEAEEEAWQFAQEFLMPEAEIRSSLYPINLDKLIAQKRKWRVSMQMILRWAKNLGVLKESYYKYLMTQISKRGWRKLEPFDDEWPREEPTLLEEIVRYHLDDLSYSAAELRAALAANIETFEVDYLGSRPSLRVV